MAPKVNTEDLIGAAEVARILGLAHHNSVSTYLTRYDDFPRPVVDVAESRIRLWLRPDVVAWRDRGALATIEREPEALAQHPRTWPDVICTPSRYLEAVLAPGPPLTTVDAVRVRQTYLDRLEDLSVLGIDGALDPGTALRELVAFEAMNRWRVDHGVAIEGVG